jgi:regulator of protease activity HflC (stomatin/prohibitin superfamily)
MIALVFLVLVTLAVLGVTLASAVFYRRSKRNYGEGSDAKWVLLLSSAIGIPILMLAWFLSSFTIVSASDVGVPIAFGKVGTALESGPHFIAPWTDVETYPKKSKTVDEVVETMVSTSQAGSVKVKIAPRWHTDEKHADETWRQTRTSDDEELEKGIIRPTAVSAAQDIINTKTNSEALVRAGFEEQMKTTMQEKLSGFGIVVDAVYLRGLEPGDEKTKLSIAGLASQQQATNQAVEAARTAEKLKEVAKINAEAAKEAAAKIPPNLSPAQVTVLCAQIWERAAAAADRSGNALYTAPCGNTSGLLVNTK